MREGDEQIRGGAAAEQDAVVAQLRGREKVQQGRTAAPAGQLD